MMRKIFWCSLLLGMVCSLAFSEIEKKDIQIDNLYRVEQTFDTESNELVLRLFSNNDSPFDEQYAESNLEEVLRDFMDSKEFEESKCTKNSIDYEYDEKYTVIESKYIVK